ncbi:MAG: hypothetical protein K2X37_03665 [Chitinophagaceae bacterium]|nr:hypothetical protein [Chitinophagaceae bacterium]
MKKIFILALSFSTLISLKASEKNSEVAFVKSLAKISIKNSYKNTYFKSKENLLFSKRLVRNLSDDNKKISSQKLTKSAVFQNCYLESRAYDANNNLYWWRIIAYDCETGIRKWAFDNITGEMIIYEDQ